MKNTVLEELKLLVTKKIFSLEKNNFSLKKV